MTKENKTKYVILGLLLENSLTGYEIREIIKEPTMYFWHETDASIYPTLKVLLREGYVTSETIFVGKRKKEQFTITERGRKEFERWYASPPDIDRRRSEFLLKLYFSTSTRKNELKHHLTTRLRTCHDLLEAFKLDAEKIRKEEPHKTFWLELLQNALAHCELEINWLEKQLKHL